MRWAAPENHLIEAVLGTVLGMALFAVPAIMLGLNQASLGYPLIWAALWAPAFAWPADGTPRPPFHAILDDLRRYSRATLVSGLLILPFYLSGRYAFAA